jgi:triphosphoribosyl-dephospho-CoA synthase
MTPSEIRQAVEWACILEATAQKPGNVHPRASFADLDYLDFVRAALASSEPLSKTAEVGVGRAILDAVTATSSVAGSNVNLGIILLLAPLCAAARGVETGPTPQRLQEEVENVLSSLSVEDAEQAFAAIRLANAGGLGTEENSDVAVQPTITLREAMHLAAHRDSVARQYATRFDDVFGIGVPLLKRALSHGFDWESAILFCFLGFMYLMPDTLIRRKLGDDAVKESRRMANKALMSMWSDRKAGREEWRIPLAELDAWLREDGNKRNPGTSADLTAASLFTASVTGVFPVSSSHLGKQAGR